MINILLSGSNGAMGQIITDFLANNNYFKIVAGVSQSGCSSSEYPTFNKFSQCTLDFDVIIDFSHRDNIKALIDFAIQKNKPVIICTTGFSDEQLAFINEVSKKIPIFFSPNTSIGINLLLELVKKCVPILENSFDIEIIEKHHNKKIDAPSGTALKIAETVNESSQINRDFTYDRYLRKERRSRNEVGIHSIRGGTYVGEHTIIFAGDDEFIEIKHNALSKKIFAKGALDAASFILDKPAGLYCMNDLLNS